MHVTHLHENRELTFGELKEVLALAARGELTQVSEKFDGMNLMFTHNGRQLIAARGKSDILAGGLRTQELAEKFNAYPKVLEAFLNGFSILERAIRSLSPAILQQVFKNGSVWYSMELVYPTVSNTINYDQNSIVFHGWPVLTCDGRSVEKTSDDGGVEVLSSLVRQMQQAVNETGWKICGPSLVRLKNIADGTIVNDVLYRIETLMSRYDLTDENTIEDYLLECARQEVDKRFPDQYVEDLARRLVKIPGSKNITQLVKKNQNRSDEIRELVSQSDLLLKKWISPLENAISDFAVEVLRGMKSALVADTEAEIKRLRDRVTKAIDVIKASDNEIALQVLSIQLQKLKSVENIASSTEGVVFQYKGNAYKFVGSFAPAHQILTLFRYGRNGVKFDISEIE